MSRGAISNRSWHLFALMYHEGQLLAALALRYARCARCAIAALLLLSIVRSEQQIKNAVPNHDCIQLTLLRRPEQTSVQACINLSAGSQFVAPGWAPPGRAVGRQGGQLGAVCGGFRY